jgi:hypothetical protein
VGKGTLVFVLDWNPFLKHRRLLQLRYGAATRTRDGMAAPYLRVETRAAADEAGERERHTVRHDTAKDGLATPGEDQEKDETQAFLLGLGVCIARRPLTIALAAGACDQAEDTRSDQQH